MSNRDVVTPLNAALEGRYRIEHELGAGGMATVYLADDLKHERKVALKVLKPELAAVVGADRFLAEIKTTANLQHPNILPLFDSGEADGFLFYVMPYVEGESLRERLDREHQLPVDEAVRIATDVAGALQAAHGKGVIHRDIKPANILLSNGRPLVADFGIALAVSAAGAGRLTETGLSMGTPYYMSPEQASADQEATAASDVYSLGCVLYEMLVGDPPYSGSSPQAVLAKILMGEAPAPRRERGSIPAHVDAVIRKALEKLPADRFGSVDDFGKALNEPGFRYREVAVVGASGGAGGLWNPLSMGLAVALLAVLAWTALRPAPAAAPQRPIRTVISAPPAAAPVLNILMPDIAITPDGGTVVYQSTAAIDGAEFSVRSMGELESIVLRGPERAISPFVSPDGQWVGFMQTAPVQLQRAPIGGGPPITITELQGGGLQGASWAADGTIYFGWQNAAGLSQVASSGGVPTPLTDPNGNVNHSLPDALPNGAGVLYTINSSTIDPTNNQIAVLDLRSGEQRTLVTGTSGRYAASGHLVYVLAGTLMAVSFDLDRLEVTSDPVPMLEGVALKGNGAASFAMSQTGSLVYITGTVAETTVRTVVWVDREGREQALPLPDRLYSAPRLSPDGTRLAVVIAEDDGTDGLWVYDVGSAAGQRLTQAQTLTTPVWTTDGHIFYSAVPDGQSRAQIFSVPADGSAEAQQVLSQGGIFGDYPTAVTSDARSLIFTRVVELRHREIYRMSLDGEPVATAVLEGEFNRGSAEVSPDGRWMVYRSNQSGSMEVYVQPFPGPGPTIPVSIGGGANVAWSPDGSELIYRLEDRVMAVPFNADGGTPTLGRPVELFRGDYAAAPVGGVRMYHVAPDGRLLMLKDRGVGAGDDPLPPQVILVQNFFDELRERLPND